MEYSAFEQVEHSAFEQVERSAFGQVGYSAFGQVGHSAFGQVKHAAFGQVEHSAFGLMEHSAFGQVEHSAFGQVEHSAFGQVEHQDSVRVWNARPSGRLASLSCCCGRQTCPTVLAFRPGAHQVRFPARLVVCVVILDFGEPVAFVLRSAVAASRARRLSSTCGASGGSCSP